MKTQTTNRNPVKYRTHLQAKNTAINSINAFAGTLRKIVDESPEMSCANDLIWMSSVRTLINYCIATVGYLKKMK